MKNKKLFFAIILFFIMILIGTGSVNAAGEAFHNFTGLYVVTTEVQKGEKVDVEFYGMDDITEVKVYLMGEEKDYLSANVIDFKTNNAYFIMPNSAKEGKTYQITLIQVSCEHGTFEYATSEGGLNFTNCFERKYIKVSEKKNELYLTNLALTSGYDTIKKGENEKLSIDVEIKGTGTVNLVTMLVRHKEQKDIFALVSLNNGIIDLSNIGTQGPLIAGDYYISDLYINPGSEDYIRYSTDTQATNVLPLEFNVEFKIVNEEVEEEKNEEATTFFKSIELKENAAKQNDKVFVDLVVDNFELNQVMLSFSDIQNNNNFVVYLKDIKNAPYFIVPYTAELGEYELNYVILRDLNGNEKHYRKGEKISTIEHFDFSSKLTIEKSDFGDIDILNLDNDKLTMDIIQKIYNLDSNITIEIDASSNPVINKSLFEAIKGQDKILIIKYNDIEWIFNGNDIEESKSIDVSVQITADIDNLKGKVYEGIKIEFAKNGELPGKCLIRVYNSNILNEIFSHNESNVYYYNNDNGLFNKIALNVSITDDGYYEFYINHNSSYIMTKETIKDEFVINDAQEIEDVSSDDSSILNSFKSNKVDIKIIYILAIVFIFIVLILVIIIIRLARKNKKV